VVSARGTKSDIAGLYTVRVGTAGIGRMSFRAYFDDEKIDRQDSDDEDVYSTPGQALAALGREMDYMLVAEAWDDRFRAFERAVADPSTDENKNKIHGPKRRLVLRRK